jgi:hypothetical protein
MCDLGPAQALELFPVPGVSVGHVAECTEFLEYLAGEVDGAGALRAGAKKNGQKLRITQSSRSLFEEFLSRPVILRPSLYTCRFSFFHHSSLLCSSLLSK